MKMDSIAGSACSSSKELVDWAMAPVGALVYFLLKGHEGASVKLAGRIVEETDDSTVVVAVLSARLSTDTSQVVSVPAAGSRGNPRPFLCPH